MLTQLTIKDRKSCFIFKTALTKYEDDSKIKVVFQGKNIEVENVAEVKAAFQNNLTTVDIEYLNVIKLADLKTSRKMLCVKIFVMKQTLSTHIF